MGLTDNKYKPQANRFTLKLMILVSALSILITFTGCLKTSSSVKGNVSGKVYDSNGKALRGVKVEVYGTPLSTTTDSMGGYIIYNIEPGQKQIVATHEDKSVIIVVNIVRGETVEGANLTFAVLDKLPPVITEVKAINLTENSVDITWNTNKPSDSNVDYATLPIGLDPFIMTMSNSAMVEEHSISLIDLLPGRTYHYRIRSYDFNYNEGISSDYQFTTPKGDAPAVPTNFVIYPPTEMERVLLAWSSNTEDDLAGYNLYRAESLHSAYKKVNADPIPASDDAVVTYRDDGLKIAVKYYYRVSAVDLAGNESEHSTVLSIVTPGTLLEDRLWKVSESPYVLYGDLRVRAGSTLTIEPGTEVRFSMTNHLPDPVGAPMSGMIVQGGLKAIGKEDSRIVFTSAESFPRKGSWAGITFLGTVESNNTIRYATVMFGEDGIRSEASSVSVEYSEFGLCGIGLNIGMSPTLNIRYNTIRDCDIGAVSLSSNIRNNLFLDNQVGVSLLGNDIFENNTVDCLIGVQVEAGRPTIKNNIIAYTGTTRGLYGISQTQELATPTISFNDIFNYAIPYNNITDTGTSNIEEDPLFIGGAPYNYKLQTVEAGYANDSPCLKGGENESQMGRYGP